MTEIYLQVECSHYGLCGNAPVLAAVAGAAGAVPATPCPPEKPCTIEICLHIKQTRARMDEHLPETRAPLAPMTLGGDNALLGRDNPSLVDGRPPSVILPSFDDLTAAEKSPGPGVDNR